MWYHTHDKSLRRYRDIGKIGEFNLCKKHVLPKSGEAFFYAIAKRTEKIFQKKKFQEM